MTGPLRRSALVAALLTTLTTAQTRKIFDEQTWRWWFVGLALLCLLVGFLAATQSRRVRWPLAVATTLAATGAAVQHAGGSLPGDLFRSLTNGGSELLSGRWPAAGSPLAIGFVAFIGALMATLTMQCVIERTIGPARIFPSVIVLAFTALFAPLAGPPSTRFLAIFVLLAVLLLWLSVRDRADADELGTPPAVQAREPRRLALASTAALLLAPILGASLMDSDRYDARLHRADPSVSEQDLSPLTVVDQLRTRTPDIVLFEASGTPVTRWRLVGLNRFDGRAWMAPGNLRQAGTRLVDQRSAGDAPGARTVNVTVKGLEGQWLPTPAGRTFEISVPVLTDGTASSLLSTKRVSSGTTYRVIGNELGYEDRGANSTQADRSVMADIPEESKPSAAIATLATQITSAGTSDREKAELLGAYLRDNYTLDSQAASGHSSGLVELFLTKSKHGRREQFVAGYALLAHSIGLPVRIAVGFMPPDGSTQVMSSSAFAWPEVAFQGAGWQAFDPVPAAEGKAQRGTNPQAPNAQVQTPSPTTVPPLDVTTPPSSTPPVAERSSIPATSVAGIIAGVVLLLLAVGYILGILDLKKRQRRRRAEGPTTNAQVLGAFWNGTDRLMDLGVRLPASATDRELVAVGAQVLPAASELAPLADMATEAAYGDRAMDPSEVGLANEYLHAFETATASVTRRQLLRARFSLRSVRKGFGLRAPKPVNPTANRQRRR